MHMTTRFLTALLLFTMVGVGVPLGAQGLSVAAGITRMPGRLGDASSDRGAILRVGMGLKSGRHLSWSVEGSVERLNEQRRQFVQQCVLPGGAIGSCSFDTRSRDTGWSLGTTLRVAPWMGAVRPYALVGLGFLRVREHGRTVAVDGQGNTLDNFSYDGTYNDDALQGHLGAGVNGRPTGWPVTIFVEGRATRLLYSYSGGLYADWNPTVVVGVRW
jgi:hypothetical protein